MAAVDKALPKTNSNQNKSNKKDTPKEDTPEQRKAKASRAHLENVKEARIKIDHMILETTMNMPDYTEKSIRNATALLEKFPEVLTMYRDSMMNLVEKMDDFSKNRFELEDELNARHPNTSISPTRP